MTTATMLRGRSLNRSLTFWTVWLRYYGASDKLAAELWAMYERQYPLTSQTVLWQLSRMCDRASHDEELMARIKHLERILPPKAVLRATVALSPEGHGVRRRDVVQLEHQILEHVNREGEWK